jgi:hypothetical protein
VSTKKWQAKNPEKSKLITKLWREKNFCHNRDLTKQWLKRNPGKSTSYCSRRKAAKLQAMPQWLNAKDLKAIDKIYTKAVKLRKAVDHIVPLRSKLVCGLHWHRNLRVLSLKANLTKGNRHWSDMP